MDLDDAVALATADTGGMLLAVASAAAQVREAAALSVEAGLVRLADEGRPRAVVVCGAGSSAAAGEVLAVVAGPACRVPVVVHRGPVLPVWVGAADLVVAVAADGEEPAMLGLLEEAVRRGCRLLVVAAGGSPAQELARRGRGAFVPVTRGRVARAGLWSLAVPLLVAADALGLASVGPPELDGAATVLEQVATRCRPDADTVANPGKTLAVELDGAVPVLWGASALAGAAARRFAARLSADAGVPAAWGALPDDAPDLLGVLDGPWVAGPRSEDELFADREDEPEQPPLRVVLLREPGETPGESRLADACRELALGRGVGVSALLAEGTGPLARLAGLVGVLDFASTYLALARGADPTPVAAAAALERRTMR